MPATALDPKTALVVIDLQKGISKLPTVHPAAGVIANTRRLVDAFRRADLPVVLVTVALPTDDANVVPPRTEARFNLAIGPDFSELVPELEDVPGALRITKRGPNAFFGTELDAMLRRRRVTGIVLTGISTSGGVDSTARAAHELAYNLTFASDAMTDMDPALHELVLKKIFPRRGEVDTTDGIVALLQTRR